jgi:hypothetical protein
MKSITPPNCVIFLCLSLFTFSPAQAQDAANPAPASKSLADLAREANKNKAAHAKTVISDDNLPIEKGPIPALNFEGVDNSDDISAAIDTYRKSHSTKETDDLIHAWYDKYYAMFVAAMEENKTLVSREQDRYYNQADSTNYNQDPKKYRQLRDAEARSARNDQKKVSQNGLMEARIQSAFVKVRSELMRMGLRYSWFKVPFGNGNGSY